MFVFSTQAENSLEKLHLSAGAFLLKNIRGGIFCDRLPPHQQEDLSCFFFPSKP